MATRIESFTVTIPAKTLQSAPVNILTSFNQGQVDEIQIDIPPGPSGLMGFQIAYGDQVIIPHDPSKYIIRDGRQFNWPLQNFPDGSFWSVIGYNTDIYDHDVDIIFLITEVGLGSAQPGSVVAAGTVTPIEISSQPPAAVTA